MKKKYLIGALTMPLLIAACSNEEFVTTNVNKALDGNKIELAKNFTLVGEKGSSTTTRAGLLDGLVWYPTVATGAVDDANILTDAQWDQIGLAWLNETPGAKVYTNYRFQHYGWLNEDETAPVLDKCADNKVKNGVFFTGATAQTEQFQRYDKSSDSYVNVADFWTASEYQFDATTFDDAKVNPRNGLFNTDNSTVFSGTYLVYYPFNSDLKDIDYLTAKSGKVFGNADTKAEASTDVKYTGDYRSQIGTELFMVGRTEITGGTQAGQFEMGILSGMIAVQVVNASGSTLSDITKVVLYAKGEGFITSVKLDADKIQTSGSAAQGTALYVAGEEVETSNTLISEASAAVTLANKGYTVFGYAALPTTATNVIAIVQDQNGNSYATQVGNITINPNKWSQVVINVTAPLNSSTLYAYDQTSLTNAVRLAASATKAKPSTINVLGEVEVSEKTTIPAYTTVTGYTDNDKLIVKNSTSASVELGTTQTSVIDCNIDIEGLGCCGKYPAILNMVGGTLNANKTIKNYGTINFFGDNTTTTVIESTIRGIINNLVDPEDEAETSAKININKYASVSLHGEVNAAKGTELLVDTEGVGNIGKDGTLNIYSTGALTNNGNVTIKGNVGTQGQFVNNATITEKVSAQITGKGVTSQADDAAYVCEVNSLVRYNAATNNDPNIGIRPTTLVRFVDVDPSSTFNHTYTLEPNKDGAIKNINGRVIDFESKLEAAGKTLTILNATKSSTAVPTTIGDFSVTGGGLTLNHAALTVKNVVVNHAAATTEKVLFNTKLKVLGNMNFAKVNATECTIAKGVNVTGNVIVNNTTLKDVIFAAASKSTIEGNVTCQKNGMMKFDKNSVTTIYGANGFTNDGKVNIVPQTSLTGTDVAAIVLCRKFTNFGDSSKWTNNSYPSMNENL